MALKISLFVNQGITVFENVHLGKYEYTVGNLVLRRRDFRTYIRRSTSPNENFEYSYPHSNALLQFRLALER